MSEKAAPGPAQAAGSATAPPGNGSPAPRGDLGALVEALVQSYRGDPRGQYLNRRFVPSKQEILEIVELLLSLFYPGYYGEQKLTDDNVAWHVGATLVTLREKLERQLELCLCHGIERSCTVPDLPGCGARARTLADELLGRLPAIRARLLTDAQAAFDGDPAAGDLDEIILAYPGMLAVTVHRVAHELYLLGVPLMPRILAEWAHAQTGCDIHPGATIGDRFFVDHATGVVIGETATLGQGVRMYQGVTLGAISLPRDAQGRVKRMGKRHPTVEDNVTLYANASVLGGETVLGKGSVIGGGVFLTKSIEAGSRVALDPPRLRVAPRRGEHDEHDEPPGWWDFEI